MARFCRPGEPLCIKKIAKNSRDYLSPFLRHPHIQLKQYFFSRLQRCLGIAGLLPPLPHVHPSDPSMSAEETELWKKPSLREVLRADPRRPLLVTLLVLVTSGLVAGWVIASQISAKSDASHRASGDASRIITINTLLLHVAFAISTLTALYFTCHCTSVIVNQFKPPSQRCSSPIRSAMPWLTSPTHLPSYVHAVDIGRNATGDVEDRFIVGEPLPRYGNIRGSTLPLRSESRTSQISAVPSRGRPDSYTTLPRVSIISNHRDEASVTRWSEAPAASFGYRFDIRRSVDFLQSLEQGREVTDNAICIR